MKISKFDESTEFLCILSSEFLFYSFMLTIGGIIEALLYNTNIFSSLYPVSKIPFVLLFFPTLLAVFVTIYFLKYLKECIQYKRKISIIILALIVQAILIAFISVGIYKLYTKYNLFISFKEKFNYESTEFAADVLDSYIKKIKEYNKTKKDIIIDDEVNKLFSHR